MPINFPNSPSPSQLYTYDNKTWEWNGVYWEVYSALTGYITSAYTVGDGYSSISGVSGGNIALKSFSGDNITIIDTGSKLTFSIDSLNNYLPLSGGTVFGATIFTSNLSANTLSATTYENLPTDVFITGGTYSAGTATFTNNTGGTFNVTGFTTGGTSSPYQVILQAFEESDFVLSGTAVVFFRIPASLNGLNLTDCGAQIANTGTTGNTTVMISRGRQSSPTTAPAFVDMLTTAITIEYNIFDSKDSLIPPVINTSNDDIATGDRIRINVPTISTGVQGLSITLKFE
jgi:hypothetical protein